MKDIWAIRSEASLETKMNVQRLSKFPNVLNVYLKTTERVDYNSRKRDYGVDDKSELIIKISKLYENMYRYGNLSLKRKKDKFSLLMI